MIVALLAVAASGLACLVLLARSQPAETSEAVRLISPDARWTLTVRDEIGMPASHSVRTRAVLARADGSDARTVYQGEPARAEWRSPARVVFVETGSGRRHAIAVPGGSYDYRFDEPHNLAAFIAWVALPGVIVALVGVLIIRRRSRVARRAAGSEAGVLP
ncbi:MAG TPA: hypothetical protein VIK03_08325 [Thermoleophilia bacterium]